MAARAGAGATRFRATAAGVLLSASAGVLRSAPAELGGRSTATGIRVRASTLEVRPSLIRRITPVHRAGLAGTLLGRASVAQALPGSRSADARTHRRAATTGGRGRTSRSGIPATAATATGSAHAGRHARLRPATTQAAAQDRLRPDGAIGLEAGHDRLRDRRAEHDLDLAQELELVDAHQ